MSDKKYTWHEIAEKLADGGFNGVECAYAINGTLQIWVDGLYTDEIRDYLAHYGIVVTSAWHERYYMPHGITHKTRVTISSE